MFFEINHKGVISFEVSINNNNLLVALLFAVLLTLWWKFSMAYEHTLTRRCLQCCYINKREGNILNIYMKTALLLLLPSMELNTSCVCLVRRVSFIYFSLPDRCMLFYDAKHLNEEVCLFVFQWSCQSCLFTPIWNMMLSCNCNKN